eukprot:scaffold66381_cov63-Phaeocystis_antarctica.AAC.15
MWNRRLQRWPAARAPTAVMLALRPSVEALDVVRVSALGPQRSARVALLARPPARMRSPARVARVAAGRAERPLPRACGPAPPPRARPPAAIAQWAKPAAWGAHPPPLGPPCALCACKLRGHLEGRTSSSTSLGPRGSEGR